MKKLALVLAVIMMFSCVLTACNSKVDDSGALCVNVGPEPNSIDPALNTTVDGATLVIHAFEGLMILDKDGLVVPGQAEKYTVSDDGLTYTFTLRDDLKWSDGSKLTAEDFVYSWNRAVSPETAADYAYMYECIKGYDTATLPATSEDRAPLAVEAKDEKTIVVTLNAPTPYFLELCAFPAFSPVKKDIVEKYGEAWARKPESYVGNGPYKLVEWKNKGHMLYVKNENYRDVESLGPDKIKFILLEDDNAILSAFKNEEILFADTVANAEIDTWKQNEAFKTVEQFGTYYVSFNTQKEPLNNPKVRKALTLAVDRNYIVDKIGKLNQTPMGAYVPASLSDADKSKNFREVGGQYYNTSPESFESNLEEAKRLLAEAGYPNGEGFPTITYSYNDTTLHANIAEALQDMWSKLGITVNLELQEWNLFVDSRKTGNYYTARNGWLADYNDPISFLDMWITGGGNNDAQWSNAEYDQLIKDIKVETDINKRFEMMHKAEDIIFEESMLCPIMSYVDEYLQSPKLKGVWSSPLGYKYFMYATVEDGTSTNETTNG